MDRLSSGFRLFGRKLQVRQHTERDAVLDPLASLPERRERYRIALSGTVWCLDDNSDAHAGVLTDLSAKGLGFIAPSAPLPGAQLVIYVQLLPRESLPLVGDAVVVQATLRRDGRYAVRCSLALPLQ